MSNDSGWQQQSGDQGRPFYGDVPRYGQNQSYHQPPQSTDQPPQSYGQPPQAYGQSSGPDPSVTGPPWTQPPQASPYGSTQPYDTAYGPGFLAAPQSWGQPDPRTGFSYPAPVPTPPLASWGRRVGAYLLDLIPNFVAYGVFAVGYVQLVMELSTNPQSPDFSAGSAFMIAGGVIALAALGWQIYNRWLTAGRTGQSLGKRVLKIKLLGEQTLRPIGPLNAFVRDLVHILDGIAYVGYLWPLWDERRQTFSDKIMKTVVVDARADSIGLSAPNGQQGNYGG